MQKITRNQWIDLDKYRIVIRKTDNESCTEIWDHVDIVYDKRWSISRPDGTNISLYYSLTDEEVQRMVLPRII